MEAAARIEQALEAAFALSESPGGPPGLAAAMRHAVFPGGARVRPRLCLAVAAACGDDLPPVTDSVAAAIELLHCASLVHDDLPCFDDAPMRRGRPSVHSSYGERLAVLAGDALIVQSFQVLASVADHAPQRLPVLLRLLGAAVGAPFGIVAGQAWECEPRVAVSDYHRAKTGSLFAAASMTGAAAAGFDPQPWHALGDRLGEAFQVADDLRDALASSDEIGKPVGRDAVLGRPSAVQQHGVAGAALRLKQLIHGAVESIPDCPGAAQLRTLIVDQAGGFLPAKLARRAA